MFETLKSGLVDPIRDRLMGDLSQYAPQGPARGPQAKRMQEGRIYASPAQVVYAKPGKALPGDAPRRGPVQRLKAAILSIGEHDPRFDR